MHTLIYALVAAQTRADALTAGKQAFDRLVGCHPGCGPFDYYVTFDDTDSSVAGPARWGDLPVATPVESVAGQALLERGWEATEREFQRNLDHVRTCLSQYSDADIMADTDFVRFSFRELGVSEGASVFLYDADGCGLRTPGELEWALEQGGEVWIVPADVHY